MESPKIRQPFTISFQLPCGLTSLDFKIWPPQFMWHHMPESQWNPEIEFSKYFWVSHFISHRYDTLGPLFNATWYKNIVHSWHKHTVKPHLQMSQWHLHDLCANHLTTHTFTYTPYTVSHKSQIHAYSTTDTPCHSHIMTAPYNTHFLLHPCAQLFNLCTFLNVHFFLFNEKFQVTRYCFSQTFVHVTKHFKEDLY